MVNDNCEARLNLIINLLNNGELESANKLIEDMEPDTPQEYIIKVLIY